ncbi:MAG: DUF1983 domain-containing protein, partial [Mixta calida]|nr:DUF1983 domain-containing protein [Mixta calida]
QVPGSFTRLTGLMRDTYTAHVIAVNQMGAESPEAYLEFSIEAPPPPSKVEQKQGYFSVTLIPRLAEITNISTQFDFWTSGQTKLANINADTVEGNASRAGTGTTWTAYELQIGPVYYWYVRTINAFGTSAFIEVPVVCNTDTGELIDYIDEQIRESGAFDRLSSQIDTNIEGMLQNALDNKSSVDHQFRQYGEVRADILTVRTTIADVSKAMAEQNTLVQAQIGNLTSSVNQKLTATVNSDGSASAFYDVGLQILRNGQYYKAGMAMGIEPSGGGYKSTLAFSADQFGIYTGNNPGNYQLAFAAINGQIFIRSALIQDASIDSAKIKDAAITNAKIAGTLESVGYASGNGWQFGKDNNQLNFRSANSGFFIDSTGAGLKSSAGVVLVKMGLRP